MLGQRISLFPHSSRCRHLLLTLLVALSSTLALSAAMTPKGQASSNDEQQNKSAKPSWGGLFKAQKAPKKETTYEVHTSPAVAGVRGKADQNKPAEAKKSFLGGWFKKDSAAKKTEPAVSAQSTHEPAEPTPAQPQALETDAPKKSSFMGSWFKKDTSAPKAETKKQAGTAPKKSFLGGWFKKDSATQKTEPAVSAQPTQPTHEPAEPTPAQPQALETEAPKKGSFIGSWFKKDNSAPKAETKKQAGAAPKKSFLGGWFKKDSATKNAKPTASAHPTQKKSFFGWMKKEPAKPQAHKAEAPKKSSFIGSWFKKDNSAPKAETKKQTGAAPKKSFLGGWFKKDSATKNAKPTASAKPTQKKSFFGWMKKDPAPAGTGKSAAPKSVKKKNIFGWVKKTPATQDKSSAPAKKKSSFFSGLFKRDANSDKVQGQKDSPNYVKPVEKKEKKSFAFFKKPKPAPAPAEATTQPTAASIQPATAKKSGWKNWSIFGKKTQKPAAPSVAAAAPDQPGASAQKKKSGWTGWSLFKSNKKGSAPSNPATAETSAPAQKTTSLSGPAPDIQALSRALVVASILSGARLNGDELQARRPYNIGTSVRSMNAPYSAHAPEGSGETVEVSPEDGAKQPMAVATDPVLSHIQGSTNAGEVLTQSIESNPNFVIPTQVPDVQRVNLVARNEALGSVLQRLSTQLNLALELTSAAQPYMNDPVSIQLVGTPYTDALDWILGFYHLRYHIRDGVLRI